VPAGILRDLGKRQAPGAELAEKILEHLQRCRWRLVHELMTTLPHRTS